MIKDRSDVRGRNSSQAGDLFAGRIEPQASVFTRLGRAAGPLGSFAVPGAMIAVLLFVAGCQSVPASEGVPRVSPEELREKMDRKGPLLVVFACTHDYTAPPPIEGSIGIDTFQSKASWLPKDFEIILYCGCPGDRAAIEAAARLSADGFTRLRILSGGVYAWIHAGYEVSSREIGRLGPSR